MMSGIHQRVHLGDDPRRPARLRGASISRRIIVEEPLPHPARRHDQLAIARRRGEAGEHVEQVGQVGAEVGVGA